MTYAVRAPVLVAPATTGNEDDKLVQLWVAQRPATTVRSYLRAWKYLKLATGGMELRAMRLMHLQAFAESLRGMQLSSQVTVISAIKSLFTFALKIGYLPLNPGALLRCPRAPSDLAQRIVGEPDIQRLLALPLPPRDAVLLRLAYVSGLRIAELAGLRWKHFAPRQDGAVLSVLGKGRKLRHIFLPDAIWRAIVALRDGAPETAPVFLSRENLPLSKQSMHRIVKKAARDAGLPESFSMHWCRHAHASHAMDRGAPVNLVQQTLGHASLAVTCRYLHCKPGASSAQYILPLEGGGPAPDAAGEPDQLRAALRNQR